MLFPVLVFLCVTLALGGLYALFAPTAAERRLQAVTGTAAAASGSWTETAVRMAGPLANLSMPTGDWSRSPLRVRFLNAGLRHPDMRLLYFVAKTILPLLLAGATALALRAASMDRVALLFCVLLAALAGCYLPNLVLALKVGSRRREIFENFPDAADLLLVCVEAGLGVDAALARVADEMKRKSIALAEELHLTTLEMRAGGSRDTALHNLALRTGVEETGIFAAMLTQADRFGTGIAESLRVFSDDLRHKRHVRAEERAARIPVKMLLPLTLCIFPSVIMVVLGPALIQIVRVILPALEGSGV